MKVLFEDLARTATISSDNETASYPASNIADVFLDTRYLSTLMSDTVLIVFPEDSHALDKPCTEFEQWLNVAWWLKRFC